MGDAGGGEKGSQLKCFYKSVYFYKIFSVIVIFIINDIIICRGKTNEKLDQVIYSPKIKTYLIALPFKFFEVILIYTQIYFF